MRVATNQFYNLNTSNLLRIQSDANTTLAHLSSGKRVHTAGDDPVASIVLENLKQQGQQLSQYMANINLANNRLSQQESRIGEYETLLMNSRDLIVQGNDGALSDENKGAIAQDLTETRDAILALANNQDESGNFLFAGFQTQSKPFIEDPNGVVSYQGDNGVREAVVADGVTVPVNESGERIFMSIPNASGDYRADYANAVMSDQWFVEQANVTNPAVHVQDNFQIQFLDDGFGNVNVEVTDSGGAVVLPSQPFDVTVPLNFNGMEVQLSGNPQIGDSVTLGPQTEVDIFSTLQEAIDMLNTPSGLVGDREQAQYAQALADAGQAITHASVIRAESGNHLKSLETYQEQHENLELVAASAQSSLEDLDYAKAITEFEKQSLAMNSLSQTFGKLSGLTLFNYI
ncbi:flagellar hook-associated protein FlgL [Ferrimonas balearica]|uniref:flagellar hook-associated protein FlgL n=1 Tax=Ferrimonas balearica TaxID=44012 RepID=UPI001C99E056|nr:flagellar hook-associated protein FlgL [Ferrimonas balearica]MBY5992939.1 flagellar hook-associated protein FlgL [Ferrimonas balearica]